MTRRTSRLFSCPALGMLALAAVPSCSSADYEIGGTAVVTIDARQWSPDSEPIDVEAIAQAEGAALGVGDTFSWRPVEVIDVVDLDQLVVLSNRGLERVQVFGIGGLDERLPEDQRLWITEVGLPALKARLRGTTLYEYRCFPFAGSTGCRVVYLKRSDQLGEPGHLGSALIEDGLAYPVQPYGDTLQDERDLHAALWVFSRQGPPRKGLYALPSMEARGPADGPLLEPPVPLDGEVLQQMGEQVLDQMAKQLAWSPSEPLQFILRDRDGVEKELRRLIEAERSETFTWDEDGEPRETEYAKSVEEEAVVRLESLEGLSSQGPRIHVLAGEYLTDSQLRYLLGHEIAHQYQEEVMCRGDWELMDAVPGNLLQAHAEVLAMQVRLGLESPDEVLARGMRGLAYGYALYVETLAWAIARTGKSVDEFMAWAIDGGHRYGGLESGTITPIVWLRQEGLGSGDQGMTFSFNRDDSGGAHVEIRNHQSDTRSVQFDGWWYSRGETGWTMQSAPPFNLIIGGESSVRIKWPRSSRGMVSGTEVVGSFTETWGAILDEDTPS